MKNIFNFRFLVVLFLSIVAGIFATTKFLLGDKIYFYSFALLLILILIYWVLSIFINRPYLLNTKLKTICVITILLGSVLGGTLTFLNIKTFKPEEVSGTSTVSGKIYDLKLSSNDNKYIIIEDCKINNKKIDYNILVYFENDLDIEEGYTISFNSQLKTNKISSLNNVVSFIGANNLGYTAFATSMKIESKNVGILEQFKLRVKDVLFGNMSEDSAGFSQAVLFGDKYNLNHEIKDNFALSGVSHLLAISGLHVGIFISVIYFILNKLKIKKYISFIVSTIILLLFNILCGFVPSVVRASIMSLSLLMASCFGKRADVLSNLSFAGVILLVANPINLFDLGFRLSFLAVFGLLLLNKPIYELLIKIKCPIMLSKCIATTLSATILTLPVVADVFGFIAAGTLIANIILIPLFTIYYISLLLGLTISVIPALCKVLVVPDFLCKIMVNITNFIAKMGAVNVFNFTFIATVCFLIIMVVVSKYTMQSKSTKTVGICVLIIILCSSLIINSVQQKTYKNNIFVYNTITNCSVVNSNSGQTYIMNIGDGEESDINYLTDFLNELKIKQVKGVVISNYESHMQNFINKLLLDFSVENLYVPNSIENYNLIGLKNNINSKININLVDFNKMFYLESDLYFYALNSSAGSCKFLIYNLNNNVVAQNVSNLGTSQFINLQEEIKEERIDILIQNSLTSKYENSFWLGKKISIVNKCFLKNFENVVINNSQYVKISTQGDLMYEVY